LKTSVPQTAIPDSGVPPLELPQGGCALTVKQKKHITKAIKRIGFIFELSNLQKMHLPSYLKKGDTIALTCTAGFMPRKNAEACIKALKREGYNVIVSHTVGGKSTNYFSGTDEDRLKELQLFLDDKNIKAILCGRGGYGTGRILDKINFTKFKKYPKWVIGFSDITILLNHITQNFGIATLHAPMSTAFNNATHNPENTHSLLNCLKGISGEYVCSTNKLNKLGDTKGKLIGGNVALLANAIGTASDIKTNNCVLFIEDIGEQLYAVDRMLHQLKRAGKLKNLKALVVGNFTDMADTDRPFGKTIYEIIDDIVAEYKYPVCYDFPVGHGKENRALKIGVKYALNITSTQVSLKEII
jgi:muramoyltetrapeptide carboxypeptidase